MLKSIAGATLIAMLLGATATSFGQTVPPSDRAEVEKRLAIAHPKTDATIKEKIDALREVSFIATAQDVPALATLLADEQLSHMARYALEPIDDPSVDEALRKAAGELKGSQLVGVIGSIGARKDAEAMPLLRKNLKNKDAAVVKATARALGNIGDWRAAEALTIALGDASKANLQAICEGLFECAENLGSKGAKRAKEKAADVYSKLLATETAPRQIRAGALRGAILLKGKDDLSLLAEYLLCKDYVLFSSAVQATLEMPEKEVTMALGAVLRQLPAANQILVLQSIGKRGDKSALPTLLALVTSKDAGVRVEVARALPPLADKSATLVLVAMLKDKDEEVAKAALKSLGAFPDQAIEGAVTSMLENKDSAHQLVAVNLIGRRRMTASVPSLVKAASAKDAKVRSAALKQVGELGGSKQLPQLLDLVMGYKESSDLDAAERALIAVCGKADKGQSRQVIALTRKANSAQLSVLLRTLAAIGGPDALTAIRKSLKSADAKINDAAFRAITSFSTVDAAPDLLELAKATSGGTKPIIALRGYIGLIRNEDASVKERLAMSREATKLTKRGEEKKLLLGALGTVPSPEALSAVMAQADTKGLQNEACFAAVTISEMIYKQHPGEVLKAMQQVKKTMAKNRGLVKRANKITAKLGPPKR